MPARFDDPAGPDLVALVGSRMAHDLNNPVGAIANGVELIGLTGGAGGPELALIGESVDNARRRIKTFRIAFGAAAPGQSVRADEIAEITADGANGRRVTVDWTPGANLPRIDAKRVVLGLMCVESALAWGGRVAVRGQPGSWRIDATAERMRIEPALWAMLDGAPAPADLTANQVHFALLAREAARSGRPVTVTRSETALRLMV